MASGVAVGLTREAGGERDPSLRLKNGSAQDDRGSLVALRHTKQNRDLSVRSGKNPHVSRKHRARSGAPWFIYRFNFGAIETSLIVGAGLKLRGDLTGLNTSGKNPHVSRKHRARSGAPGFIYCYNFGAIETSLIVGAGLKFRGDLTGLSTSGKNPHVSRKHRARSGAPGLLRHGLFGFFGVCAFVAAKVD